MRWGPTTYYRWPFSEHVRALVPLHPLQYTTPAKSTQLGAKAKVDLRLVVYFRVNTSNRETHQNEENVLNSVYSRAARTHKQRRSLRREAWTQAARQWMICGEFGRNAFSKTSLQP